VSHRTDGWKRYVAAWIWRLELSLTRLHIPPRLSSSPASKMTTSKPCPTQCAAAVTPVMPAPTTAMRGASAGDDVSDSSGGGRGESALSTPHCHARKPVRTGASAAACARESADETAMVVCVVVVLGRSIV
jgi:hypothetical protein